MLRAPLTPIVPLLATSLLACLIGCPGAGEATVCEDSSGCLPGEICEQGRCRVNCLDPGVECPEGTTCQHGVCLPPPVTSSPDAGGEDLQARDVTSAELALSDSAQTDAWARDAAAPDTGSGDAQTSCADDEHEPNDSADQAAPLSAPGQYGGLVSCSTRNEDWYGFTLPAGESVVVTIYFNGELADLDLALYDRAESSPLEWSAGVGSEETVSFGPVEVERELLVQVESWESTPVPYDMAIAF